jgi:hypothetical protein
MKILEKDFSEWVFRNALVTVRVNPDLKLYAGPDSPAEFHPLRRCSPKAAMQNKKASGAYEKLDALKHA